MKTRVGELTTQEANAETRPYKIIGLVTTGEEYDYNSHIVVEYLDTVPDLNAYEYRQEWDVTKIEQHQLGGWEIYDTVDIKDKMKLFHLRRVRPATESDPPNGC